MTESYPLHWPQGRPRTVNPERSRFKSPSFAVAVRQLMAELQRLGASQVILSSNIPLKLDGMPYASRTRPRDQGVAVYFTYANNPMCFACDRWDSIEDNMQAIHHTIEALRGIARWGTGDMLRAAFTGFQAIAGPRPREWWEVLDCDRLQPLVEIEAQYKRLARIHHPDNGGNADTMAQLNNAIAVARTEKSR